jgi:DNA polymerase I-like protein with 3'-5' exonuclease and polymerase domains
MKYKVNLRNAFIAPEGYYWVSADFSGQELRIVSAIVFNEYKCSALLDVFKEERERPYLIDDTGMSYENPYTDLHLVAAIGLNKALESIEPWNVAKMAKGGLDGINYRQLGKIINFSTIYGKGAEGFASDFGMSIEEAEVVLNNYFKKFPGLKKWLDYHSESSKITNRIRTVGNRLIFVGEDNAKGASNANAIGRKGPNAIIQGTGNIMIKLGLKYIEEDPRLQDIIFPASICVHDEINLLVPGPPPNMNVIEGEKEDTLKIVIPEEVKNKANLIKSLMEEAQSYLLSPLINEDFPSKASVNIGLSWIH